MFNESIFSYQEQLRRSHMSRGRWSVPGFEGSVDLDTLVDAPSPPARKGTLRVCVLATGIRFSSSSLSV